MNKAIIIYVTVLMAVGLLFAMAYTNPNLCYPVTNMIMHLTRTPVILFAVIVAALIPLFTLIYIDRQTQQIKPAPFIPQSQLSPQKLYVPPKPTLKAVKTIEEPEKVTSEAPLKEHKP